MLPGDFAFILQRFWTSRPPTFWEDDGALVAGTEALLKEFHGPGRIQSYKREGSNLFISWMPASEVINVTFTVRDLKTEAPDGV